MSVSHDIKINDSFVQGDLCNQEDGYSNKNVLGICGTEYSPKIDGMNLAERLASTSSVVEGDGSSEIFGECDFQPVTTEVVLSGFLSSETGEPDKDNLFGLQKTFSLASEKLCCTISHVYTPLGEL